MDCKTKVILSKGEYDELIDIKENFDKKIKHEKQSYCKHLELNNLFLKFDGIFKPLDSRDIQYSSFVSDCGDYILKNVHSSVDYLEKFSEFRLKRAEKELNKLKNHWLVKLFGL